jgi:hypothetical protein
MKVITLKNEDGETIEVQRGPIKGQIQMRHSDVDKEGFGEFVELGSFLELTRLAGAPVNMGAMKKGGFDATMIHEGQTMKLDAKEIAMIRRAVTQLG